MKKKVTWITYDCFIDCDISVIKELKNYFEITWFIMFPVHNMSRFQREDFLNDTELIGINLQFRTINFRLRRPKSYMFWIKLAKEIKQTKSDIIYFNGDATLFNLPMIWSLDKKKLTFTVHEGLITTDNIKQLSMINMARRLTMPYVKYFNFFTNSQALHFSNKFKKGKIFVIPLALKDFGESKQERLNNEVVFFNFGTILPKKNIDLLIEAGCNLYEKGYRGFKVAIIGNCSDWDYYQAKIVYPEIFICDIRFIDNSEIKEIFAKYHYLVLPYKTASQSGPLKIAFNYNIPVIVSDEPGFKEEVVDGLNGFVFKTRDLKSLESVLINVLNNHTNYHMMREKMERFVEDNYSIESIGSRYISMFNEVM